MLSRFIDLTAKLWKYALGSIEQPRELPRIFWQAMAKGVHLGELVTLSRYRRWLETAEIRTVLDVGAHRGEFASAIRALLPSAQIYSFEPLSDCYERLSSRLARDGHFRAFCVALGDRRGEITFWRSSFTKASSALPMMQLHKQVFPWSAESTQIAVEAMRLDDLVDELKFEGKTLMKIDVQGYEERVLNGAQKALRYVDYMLVEVSFQSLYDGQASFHSVYELMITAGFEFAGNLSQLESPRDGKILQADALFIRKRRI